MLEISSERSSTIILPLPIELFARFWTRATATPTPDRDPRGPAHGAPRLIAPGRGSGPAPGCRRSRRPPRTSSSAARSAAAVKTGRRRRRCDSAPRGGSAWCRTLSGLRASGGRHPLAGAHPLVRGAGRRAGGARRAGVEERDAPFALINEGRLAGASLPHSHSQLVWTGSWTSRSTACPSSSSRSRSPGAEVSSQPFIRSAQARTSASSPATDRSPTASCSSATSFTGFGTSRARGPGTRGSIRDRRGTSTSSAVDRDRRHRARRRDLRQRAPARAGRRAARG